MPDSKHELLEVLAQLLTVLVKQGRADKAIYILSDEGWPRRALGMGNKADTLLDLLLTGAHQPDVSELVEMVCAASTTTQGERILKLAFLLLVITNRHTRIVDAELGDELIAAIMSEGEDSYVAALGRKVAAHLEQQTFQALASDIGSQSSNQEGGCCWNLRHAR